MASIDFSMKGEFKNYKEQRQKELVDKLNSGMERACIIVENQAKLNVSKSPPAHPQVQTGRLRSSITHKVTREAKEIKGQVGTNVEYAKSLEFGTTRHPPYPWLFPALEAKKNEIKEALAKG